MSPPFDSPFDPMPESGKGVLRIYRGSPAKEAPVHLNGHGFNGNLGNRNGNGHAKKLLALEFMPVSKRARSKPATAGSSPIPKIALLIETSRGYGRAMLRGIVRYSRLHGPWSFYITPGDFEQALPKIQQWGGAGLIARVETEEVARQIIKANVPTVILDPEPRLVAKVPEFGAFCEVYSDSEGAARVAAQHLLERGFENFAFVGLRDRVWSDRRCKAFRDSVRSFGFDPFVYTQPRRKADRAWDRENSLLTAWIQDLPKPVAIMACDDDRGHAVLEACRQAAVDVPEEVAVIGVDDDELFCELADPPLSSVALNAEHGGYRTAHLLDQLMRGEIQNRQTLVVEATQVTGRRSTDVKVFNGPEVSAALSFIHRNRAQDFTVDDVARAVGVSRRNLEVKFRKTVGRTILAEIQRIRLDHVKRMLRETDLSIPRIAEASGFNSASYLTQVFRKDLGVTPVNYRSKFRV